MNNQLLLDINEHQQLLFSTVICREVRVFTFLCYVSIWLQLMAKNTSSLLILNQKQYYCQACKQKQQKHKDTTTIETKIFTIMLQYYHAAELSSHSSLLLTPEGYAEHLQTTRKIPCWCGKIKSQIIPGTRKLPWKQKFIHQLTN